MRHKQKVVHCQRGYNEDDRGFVIDSPERQMRALQIVAIARTENNKYEIRTRKYMGLWTAIR